MKYHISLYRFSGKSSPNMWYTNLAHHMIHMMDRTSCNQGSRWHYSTPWDIDPLSSRPPELIGISRLQLHIYWVLEPKGYHLAVNLEGSRMRWVECIHYFEQYWEGYITNNFLQSTSNIHLCIHLYNWVCFPPALTTPKGIECMNLLTSKVSWLMHMLHIYRCAFNCRRNHSRSNNPRPVLLLIGNIPRWDNFMCSAWCCTNLL